jgi:predicted HTH domain antitoxin
MPPKVNKNIQKSIEIEGKIEIALSTFQKGEISSLRRTATIFEVPFYRLQ